MHMADISPLSPRPQGRCYLNTGGLGGLSNMALQKMVATLDPQAKFAGYGGITWYVQLIPTLNKITTPAPVTGRQTPVCSQ
jgi:hypothetical protein